MPRLRTIGVLYDPEKTGTLITEARGVAQSLGLQLLATAVRSQKINPAALRSMLGQIDALWMVPDDTVVTSESFQFYCSRRLKIISPSWWCPTSLCKWGL